ncbi:MAG TPA: hypothetical protein VIZ32_02680 [Vicinamibacterales bacterium]
MVAFLALALIGLRGEGEDGLIRSAYVAMEAIGWFVIVPFSLASLATGLIQSLGTQWGVVRHYWVVAKLLITVGASLLLVLHMQVVSTVAEAASSGALNVDHLRDPRMQLVADAGAASVVLLVAVLLSVFKPLGRTSFAGVQADGPQELAGRTPMIYAFWVTVIALVLAIVIRHLSGGIPGHH